MGSRYMHGEGELGFYYYFFLCFLGIVSANPIVLFSVDSG
jgi:hypothetical protein